MAEGTDNTDWIAEILVQHEGSAKKTVWNKESDLLGIFKETFGLPAETCIILQQRDVT
jgi:hypothetical protein